MTQEKVDLFIAQHAKFFPEGSAFTLRDKLLSLDDSKLLMLQTLDYKDPTTMLIVSFFGGGLGIDRFLVGDTGLGVLKLLTAGLCGLWALIDLFLIGKRAKEKNLAKVLQIL